MDVPGLEHPHRHSKLYNRAGGKRCTFTTRLASNRDAYMHHRPDSLRRHRFLAGIPAGSRRNRLRAGAGLALLYPEAGVEGLRRIDWSTAFMVGGIVTFVGVLQRMDAVNLLGHAAMNVGTPLVAAFVICMIAGLVSAFASTVGDPCGARTHGRAAGDVGWSGRVGIDERDGRVRLDRGCVTVLDDGCAARCVGCRGRTAAVEIVVDAMGTVDGDCRASSSGTCATAAWPFLK